MRSFLFALWLGCLLPVIVMIVMSGKKSTHGSGRDYTLRRSAEKRENLQIDVETFLKRAALEGMGEMELSQVALDKSGNDEVREFARQWLSDQVKISSQLQQLAHTMDKPLPRALDASHINQVKQVRHLSSADFDAAYLEFMEEDHRATVSLFNHAADTSGLEPQIKDFAGALLPLLVDRQSRLHQLQLQLS